VKHSAIYESNPECPDSAVNFERLHSQLITSREEFEELSVLLVISEAGVESALVSLRSYGL
jgi:hypothetical protein